MQLLAINGSLRRGSHNRTLLEAALAELDRNVEVVRWHGLDDLPAFSEDMRVEPASVAAFRAAIAASDAILIATPEYNASVPGALKNALDWASRPFPGNALGGKPVAVIGASTGLFGAVWAQADLRRILGAIGACVDEHDLPVGRAHEAFTDDGRLRDPELAKRLRSIVRGLTRRTVRRAA